jgi:hypothetical protein
MSEAGLIDFAGIDSAAAAPATEVTEVPEVTPETEGAEETPETAGAEEVNADGTPKTDEQKAES